MESLISLTRRPVLFGLWITFALIIAACAPSAAYPTPSSASPTTTAGIVQIGNNAKFGQILVTADGKALYTNTVDTAGTSKCTDASCTNFWLPYIANAQLTAGVGVPGSLGTITRPGRSIP